MCTKHWSPPSLRQSLLLSAYALIACSKVFMASGVSIVQPNQPTTLHRETAAKEERMDLSGPIQTMMKSFASESGGHVDVSFWSQTVLKGGNIQSDAFMEFAKAAIKKSSWSDAMTHLFEELTYVKKSGHPSKLIKIISMYIYLRDHRFPSFTVVRESPSITGIDDQTFRRMILDGLEHRLLLDWNSIPIQPSALREWLRVNVEDEYFLENPNTVLWCDYVALSSNMGPLGPYDHALSELYSHFDSNSILTKLLAAGAVTEPGSFAEGVMEALFRKWTRMNQSLVSLLHKIVPTLEKDILNGPLTLLIRYAQKDLSIDLFPTLVRALVESDPASGLKPIMPARQNENELALVDIIAAEWSKEVEGHRSETQSTSPSPLANPMFIALCELWKERGMMQSEVRELLQIDVMVDSLELSGRRRAWISFVLDSVDANEAVRVLDPVLTDAERANLLAQSLDGDVDFFRGISLPLFGKWWEDKLTSEDVFSVLKLQLSDQGLFQNRLLAVWITFHPNRKVDTFTHILKLRKWLKRKLSNRNFELELQKAVQASDGKMQHILFELLVSLWIVDKDAVDLKTRASFLSSFKRMRWFRDLEQLHYKAGSVRKKASPPN